MNHFTVLTDNLGKSLTFYAELLDLHPGARPPFKFPGLWLYAGGHPILHISGGRLPRERAGVIDHIAFSTTDLKATVARLKEHGVEHSLNRQVGTGIWQVFCHDPMGAKVELDFDPSEAAP